MAGKRKRTRGSPVSLRQRGAGMASGGAVSSSGGMTLRTIGRSAAMRARQRVTWASRPAWRRTRARTCNRHRPRRVGGTTLWLLGGGGDAGLRRGRRGKQDGTGTQQDGTQLALEGPGAECLPAVRSCGFRVGGAGARAWPVDCLLAAALESANTRRGRTEQMRRMGPAVLPVDGAVEAGKVAEEEEGSSGVEGVEGRAELAGLRLRGAMEERVRAMRTCVKCEEVEW